MLRVLAVSIGFLCIATTPAHAACTERFPVKAEGAERASVIFIHPDGAGLPHWSLARVRWAGPDGDLAWDALPVIGLYRPHMRDSLAPSSHSGGTVHAYGVKVPQDSFGMDGAEVPVAASGRRMSLMREAAGAGLAIGIVNSGHLAEPGTACFLASVPRRSMVAEIAAQLLEGRPNVILGGGEELFLPEGVNGRHGPGVRKDGRNLVEEAERAGYRVVHDRAELAAIPDGTTHVLGLFARSHTFNDSSEETLAARGLPPYAPDAPSVAEMTAAALKVLSAQSRGFFLAIEEEGSDNFSNCHNATGMLEAMRRADEVVATARAFRETRPDTLVLVAADSCAAAPQLVAMPESAGVIARGKPLPTTLPGDPATLDGIDGRNTAPFESRPDRSGRALPFAVAWASFEDGGESVVVRAEGPNATLLSGTIDNTALYAVMRRTLLGVTE
jgi:alkaline phosphatase